MPASKIRLILACGLGLVTAGRAVAAADPEAGALLIRQFKARDYNGSPVATRVLIHPKTGTALMLAGTRLYEFDGLAWTSVETDTPALRSLAVDAAGRVWLAGVDQLGYCERDERGQWRFQPLADRLPADQRKIGRVWDTLVAGDAVWFATDTQVLRWQDQAFTVWKMGGTGTLLGVGGEVYYQRKNDSLRRWDGKEFAVVSRDPAVAGPSVMRLFPGPAGSIAGMTSAGRFFELRDGQVRTTAPAFPATLGSSRLICALPRAGGGWYAGTESGLLVVDAEGRLVRRVGKAEGLTDSPVMDLTRDRDGALWVATFAGLFQIEQPEGLSVYGEAQGVPEGLAHGLLRHDGRLYLSAPTGVLHLAPGQSAGGATFGPVPGTPRYPQQLASHPSGLLVACSTGVLRLEGERLAPLIPGTAQNPMVALATSARSPEVVVVGQSAGVAVYAIATDGAHELARFPDLGQVRTIHEADGAFWIGTSTRGIHRLQPGPDAAPWQGARVTTFDSASGTLPDGGDSVVAMATPAGLTFAAGPAGQIRYDASLHRFVPDRRIRWEGRPVAAVNFATPPSAAAAWASIVAEANRPVPLLGELQPGADALAFVPAPATVQAVLGPNGASWLYAEGTGADATVWAAHAEGLIRLRPAALVRRHSPWHAEITRFEAAGGPQPLAGAARVFRYSRQPYEFAFRAPRLDRGAAVTYQTRLAGWDADWSAADLHREVRYSGLAAGHYRFEVRAFDQLGRRSSTVGLAFSVLPPPWLSRWAFAGYGAALVLAVFGIVRLRLRKLRAEQRRLEALVASRTAELAVARDEAEAANRAKSTFLAHMSHELRTPLNGVIGYAQVLLNDRSLAGTQRERADIIHASGTHLLRLINEVLDFSKIEAGRIERRDAPFHPGPLLRELASLHEPAAAAKGLAFAVRVPDALPESVSGDPQKLRQVLDNLLSNAVKFTRTGRVELGVAAAGADAWTFSVSDTGVGLSAADLAGLFQPFAQAASRPAGEPGTGLGLVITRRLVQLLGGDLQVESTPARGSRFYFTLSLPPAAVAGEPAPVGPAPAALTGPARRVLVVDDIKLNRDLLADLLVPFGLVCTACATAEEALAWLDDHPAPDLAIIDLKLPGIDGLELTRRLRARPATAHLPVIVSSASVLTFDPAAAAAAGANDFLPKPFAQPQLIELVTRLLGLAAPAAPAMPVGADRDRLDPAIALRLLDAADAGDVTALRAALTAARGDQPGAAPFLDQLEKLAATYQLECLRQLLHSRHP